MIALERADDYSAQWCETEPDSRPAEPCPLCHAAMVETSRRGSLAWYTCEHCGLDLATDATDD